MKIRLILDRIEEGVAVLTDSECRVYECSADMLPKGSAEGSAFTADTRRGKIISLTPADNPEAGKNASRLRALFNRGKNN